MTSLFKKIVSGNHVEGRENGSKARDGASREAVSVVQATADESRDENSETDGRTPAGRMKVARTGLGEGCTTGTDGGRTLE